MRSSEHQEQVALFECMAAHTGKHPELRLAFAIPNGSKRDAITGARLKREGVKRGVPDLFLPVPRILWGPGVIIKTYHGLFIELKVGRNKPTIEQRAWLDNLEAQGYDTYVCYSWYEAWERVQAYLELEPIA